MHAKGACMYHYTCQGSVDSKEILEDKNRQIQYFVIVVYSC